MSSLSTTEAIDEFFEESPTSDDWNYLANHLVSSSSSCNLSSFLIPLVEANRAVDVVLLAIKALLMSVIIAAAIGGNVLVIVAVVRNDRLRLLGNTFLVSLAVADLLVAVLVMPFSATIVIARRWPFNAAFCDVFNANDVMFSTASLLHLGCVSFDRYVAITDPFGYERRMTRRRVAAMLGLLWFLSAAIAHLPIHLGWHQRHTDELNWVKTNETIAGWNNTCHGNFSDGKESAEEDFECKFEVNQIYGVVSCAISFWFPALIMVFAYQRIYRAAERQAKFIQSVSLSADFSGDGSSTGNGKASSAVISATTPMRGVVQRHERRKMRREHKAAKTLGVILGAFLCCWLPFFIFYLTDSLCGDHCNIPPTLVAILFWVGYLNSALNPIIYAAFNRDFRHAFRRTLNSCLPDFAESRCCCGSSTTIGCDRFSRCTRCWLCCGDASPGGRRVPSESNSLQYDPEVAAVATVENGNGQCSYVALPVFRMTQSVTEETSLT